MIKMLLSKSGLLWRRPGFILGLAAIALLAAGSLGAQGLGTSDSLIPSGRVAALVEDSDEDDSAKSVDKSSKFKWGLGVDAGLEFDSNVFHVNSKHASRIDNQSNRWIDNGYLTDMDSSMDLILSATIEAGFRDDSPLGGRWYIEPEIGFDLYLLNFAKSHPAFGLGLAHTVADDGKLSLDIEYELAVFKRNYLHDATNTLGPVLTEERVYKRGVHDDFEISLGYMHEVLKTAGKSSSLSRLKLKVGGHLDFYLRSFRGPHENRGYVGLGGGVDVSARFGKQIELEFGYAIRYLAAPGDTEVMIRDEPDFDVDFNGDLDTLDDNVRTEQKVDRSRYEHKLTFGAVFWTSKKRSFAVAPDYTLTIAEYTSTGRFDTSYRERSDVKHDISLRFQWRFEKDWRFHFGFGYVTRTKSKNATAGGDDSYHDFLAKAGVLWDF